MKVIFMVSPDFLEVSFKESEKYDFLLQGYGNFQAAINRLIYTNVSDILGFAFLGSSLPKRGSKNYKVMLKFFDFCNLMESNKKFIIVTQDDVKNDIVKDLRKFRFIRFAYQDSVEFITDTVINRDVFGSILLDNYEPYEFSEEEQTRMGEFTCPSLSYCPVVPPVLFETAAKVHRMEDIEDTLDNDVILNKYKDNELIFLLREIIIYESFGIDHRELRDKFTHLARELDGKMMGIYLAFLDGVLRGEVIE